MVAGVFAGLASIYLIFVALKLQTSNGILETIIKPLPIFYLALNTPKKKFKFLFWGLLLSAGGDIALVFERHPEAFLTGLGLFLCAHLCYIIAFLKRPNFSTPRLLGALLALGFFAGSIFIITPPADMVAAVYLYSFIISLMIASTILGTTHDTLLGVLGSIVFAISDFIIAITKFNLHISAHFWVMVTYYTAQLLLHQSKLTKP